jgi:hypothetical protein
LSYGRSFSGVNAIGTWPTDVTLAILSAIGRKADFYERAVGVLYSKLLMTRPIDLFGPICRKRYNMSVED